MTSAVACEGLFPGRLTRRGFCQASAAAVLGLASRRARPASQRLQPLDRPATARSVILILNVGGPSQLETWDPKPGAPSEVRGPLKAISTRVPGVQFSEWLPRHAEMANKISVVRSCTHAAPAIHDCGHQLVQTGRLFLDEVRWPHVGSMVARVFGWQTNDHVIVGGPIGRTGGNLPHGQDAGFLGRAFDPPTVSEFGGCSAEPPAVLERYGCHRLGRRFLVARQLVERGTRFVTVNVFQTVFGEPSWDAHGVRPFASMDDIRKTVAPMYDQAVTALIEDLHDRGLLDQTLVCCLAEFGRTPRLNPVGGRDHWPLCWSVCFAGGGVQGGRAIGRSDPVAGEPADRPVSPAELLATVCHSLGVPPTTPIPGPDGRPVPIVPNEAEPVSELF
ncbi:MAG TPA: DUF1501 domain-containing protein [Planctomycetaceae bacterium]|nr:DUF1501 domain-containing protein [Planctomycetaceae bacterium]